MAQGNKKHGAGGLIKRFVGNKNTVTILGILACIATLIVGYNYRVRTAISPDTVPYAKQQIPSRQLVTADMIGNIKITNAYTAKADNLLKTASSVVNKYVSYKTNIPKGSLFYKEQLIDAEEMPDAAFANIEDGYTIFSLDVSLSDTFYNSIRQGDYIDLYVLASEKVENDSIPTKIIFAKLVQSIRVLAVKDSRGQNILKNKLENGKPSELLFAVEEDIFLLLKKAQLANSIDVKIEPVLRNSNYTEQNKKIDSKGEVSSEELKAFILDRCVEV